MIPSDRLLRVLLALSGLAAAVSLQSTGTPSFSKYDKAYYADPNVINFVRPGLVFKITSASIAQDGTIATRILVTDPQGLPLDRNGINTPGTVSMSFIAATIPNYQEQYESYTTRTATSVDGKTMATQDSTTLRAEYDSIIRAPACTIGTSVFV